MTKTILHIGGMACGMCEAHINDVIRRVAPEAKRVASSHAKGEATFQTETAPDMERLAAAIRETGYELLSWETAPVEKHGLFGKKKL